MANITTNSEGHDETPMTSEIKSRLTRVKACLEEALELVNGTLEETEAREAKGLDTALNLLCTEFARDGAQVAANLLKKIILDAYGK